MQNKIVIPNINEYCKSYCEDPISFGIDKNICVESEIYKNFDNVLKFLTKKQAIKYVKKYYKSR